jgi:hypothetical protein
MICESLGDFSMRAEQRDHLHLTTREFVTASGVGGHPMQTGWATEQSGYYEVDTGHSQMGFADDRVDAASTTPGWEARPAAEFAHFDDPGSLRSRSGKWLREFLDHFLISVASINLRSLLTAGAVSISFGLGWTGGSSFGSDPNPNATSLVQKADADIRHTGSIANATVPITTITDSNTKLSASAASPRGSSAGAIQLHAQPQNTAPHQARERTSPAAPLPARIDSNPSPRLSPAPETRPTTIEGWSVGNVNGDRAVLVGPDRVWTVKRGDTVPGLGRIGTIVRWGNRWIVATSSGLISTE